MMIQDIQIYIAYPISVPTMHEKRMTNTPKTVMVVSSLPTFNQSNMRMLGVHDRVKMSGLLIQSIHQSNMRRLCVDDSVKMPGSLIHCFPVPYLLEVSIDPTQQAYRNDGEGVAV